jgi:hypothetical protein
LKTDSETVDVLSAVVEARNVSLPIGYVPCAILVFVYSPTNGVYIKRSHSSSSASTMYIFILALGSLDIPHAIATSPGSLRNAGM